MPIANHAQIDIHKSSRITSMSDKYPVSGALNFFTVEGWWIPLRHILSSSNVVARSGRILFLAFIKHKSSRHITQCWWPGAAEFSCLRFLYFWWQHVRLHRYCSENCCSISNAHPLRRLARCKEWQITSEKAEKKNGKVRILIIRL